MTIAEAAGKCKSLASRVPKDAFILAILLLSASASFALGYLSGREAGLKVSGGQGTAVAPLPTDGRVVASKNGTKYYPVACAGASRLSGATKMTFASASAAEAAGYTLAAGCKGL